MSIRSLFVRSFVCLFIRFFIYLFACLLLWAGVQPTLDPSAETFMSIQYASLGRGGELVGVCVRCMCALCRVEDDLSRRDQLVEYF